MSYGEDKAKKDVAQERAGEETKLLLKRAYKILNSTRFG